jgi:multisubunit Na+/H+ antiporter MnhE subunit
MRQLALFIISFIFWLLLTWSAEPGSLIAGLAVAGITTLFFGRVLFSECCQIHSAAQVLLVYCLPVHLYLGVHQGQL